MRGEGEGGESANLQLGIGYDDAALAGIGSGGTVHRQAELLDTSGVLVTDNLGRLRGGNVFILFACRGLGGWGVLFGTFV